MPRVMAQQNVLHQCSPEKNIVRCVIVFGIEPAMRLMDWGSGWESTIFLLESKWMMPWSGRGLGLWGCKDSVRHFITSQIGQPTASTHFRHAFQNLQLVFQYVFHWSSQWWKFEEWVASFIQRVLPTRFCWPWSSDSCGILLIVAVKCCNTWYKWKTLLSQDQTHISKKVWSRPQSTVQCAYRNSKR